MNKSLSAGRTGYSTSANLYGGDIALTDADLDNYFTSGGVKGKSSSKKKKSQTAVNNTKKNKFDATHGGNDAKPAQKKAKKSHTPIGFVNLGYGNIDESSSLVFSQTQITGTCTKLEKDYLRLTTAADPANVRPPHILAQALSMVKRKWIDTQDYEYVCNQLKSIRQDLTVQHTRNPFTVEVYETHARIALETNDYQEFAQCQTQLQLLYQDGHTNGFDRECEFAAYKILYACLMIGPSDSGLVSFMNALDEEHKEHEAVVHALAARSALLTTNYHQFFSLWLDAPNMSGYLMDPLADSMRARSARIIISAYRPRLSLSQFAHMLAFDREEEANATQSAAASPTMEESRPPSIGAQKQCKQYLDTKFEGMIVWVKEANPDGLGPGKYYVDCKSTFDKLAPTNAQHRQPINSGRAKHTVSSSSSSISAAAASPAHHPIAPAHDVASWIKKDAADSTGRIALGRLNGGSPMPTLSLGSSAGQPLPRVSLSPVISPSPSPSPPPAALTVPIDDAVSRKRKNSQPLTAMTYEELKGELEQCESILLNQKMREQYDAFNLQLLMSRHKAIEKAMKKAKKNK